MYCDMVYRFVVRERGLVRESCNYLLILNVTAVSFERVLPRLGSRVMHKRHVPRDQYWTVLQQADVVVSTAKHKFFGVAR